MLLVSIPVAAVEVYKWTDADGRTRYTDIPPPSNIPYVTLTGKKSTPTAAAVTEPSGEAGAAGEAPAAVNTPDKPASTNGSAKPQADKKLEEAKKKLAAEEERKKKEDEQKLREKNCLAAKSNLLQLREGGRIYSTNEKGEREYLADADRAIKIADAEKEVEEWCKPK